MSKHPSPRVDQLRAMREAKFARNEQREQETEKAATPAKTKSKTKKKPHAVRRRSCMSPFRSSRANSLRCPNSPE
jgi:hypothetical protein